MRSSIQTLLDTHHPADATESTHLQRMGELCAGPEDATSRKHFVPGHFTASGFVLSPKRDALLLIHHRKLKRWLQPGGHVDATDEDLLAASRREVREEVGLDDLPLAAPGIFDLDVHAIPALGDEPAHEHFDVRFLFQATGRDFSAADEVLAARWVPLATLAEDGDEHADASVMRVVRKLLGS